ncbi:MAG: hypothetical protein ACI9MF_002131 [Gammaproteobacteria bacterium]|jgi:hypothetical protein
MRTPDKTSGTSQEREHERWVLKKPRRFLFASAKKILSGRRKCYLACAVSNTAFAQIVRSEFHRYLVASQNADVVFAHFAGNMCGHDMVVFQLHAKHSVRKCVDDFTFHFNLVFFCHSFLGSVVESRAFCLKMCSFAKGDLKAHSSPKSQVI